MGTTRKRKDKEDTDPPSPRLRRVEDAEDTEDTEKSPEQGEEMRRAQALVTSVVLLAATSHAADKIDPRLAVVRKAWIQPVDELADEDRPVAACLADHLSKLTPIEAVKTKAEADVIFRVGSTSTQATITAYLPDGTTALWSDTTPLKAGFAVLMVRRTSCRLANTLLDMLREAMRKARG